MWPGDIIVSPGMPRTLAELRVPAALIIGAVWVVAFTVGVVTESWVALGVTTPVLTIVAMAIFSFKNGNGPKP